MAVFGVTAVRFDTKGKRVVRIKWGSIDPAKNAWSAGPTEVDVIEAVDAIHDGHIVQTIFPAEKGGTVSGPRLQVVVHENGFEGIEVENPEQHKGRTVRDLPSSNATIGCFT